MFERTFTFWRRLVGEPQHNRDTQTAEAERRLWIRYPAELKTRVQPANGAALEHRVAAQVRDISLGGANLLVDRCFDTGQMLSLELPQAGTGDRHTVLACVVRAIPEGEGQWALGCVFSRELTEEDLQGFGAQKVRHETTDQRTWKRFATNLQAHFQKIGDPEEHAYFAQVINVSASGVGLAVTEPVEAGALLSVDLESRDGTVIRTILACVVHVTAESKGDWSLGCNFIRELSEADLKALI